MDLRNVKIHCKPNSLLYEHRTKAKVVIGNQHQMWMLPSITSLSLCCYSSVNLFW